MTPQSRDDGNLPVLKVAVVGHTNTGKTSLLRTLMRDETFGEVSDRPATTRHVERATLLVRGRPLVELYDTPGLEDSIGLLEHLEQARGGRRIDGVDQIHTFLSSAEADAAVGRFAQEAKALRQVLASDVALYVIDARDRVLGKHRDELEILARCARPVVPVLNFTASPDAQIALWREHLSRVNMHAVAEFDTVVLDEHTERRLLEKVRTLLDQHQSTINALIEEREQLRAGLVRTSCSIIADMLIDVASHQVSVRRGPNDQSAVDRAMEALRQRVREREQRCVEQLLQLHRFSKEDCLASDLPVQDGRWGIDLFNPAAMKQFGIRTGGAAAAGAMAGLTLDVISHGLTLGTATALGAAIGGAIGIAHTHGRRMVDRVRGRSELAVDDRTLRLLMARQTALLHDLLRRGHASLEPIRMRATPSDDAAATASPLKAPRTLPPIFDEIRLQTGWSRLQNDPSPLALSGQGRQNAQDRLAREVEQMLR
jgi:GTPase Era involved in 16S rRNA processing